jgi:hypothetical protein
VRGERATRIELAYSALGQLEIDAVSALTEDLRAELDAYEQGSPSSRDEPEPGD